jgi:hypothetical protein
MPRILEAVLYLLVVAGIVGHLVYWTRAFNIVQRVETKPGQASVFTPWWMFIENILPPDSDYVRKRALAYFTLYMVAGLILLLI